MKTHTFDGRGASMLVTISLPELAIRMVEVLTESERPDGKSAAQLLLALKKHAPDVHDSACELAEAASDYFLECMQAGKKELLP